MLKKLKLTRYKGFKSFSVNLAGSVLLIGPNNAGKSTIINAVRLCGAAARVAMRSRAAAVFRDQDRWVRGHPMSAIADDGYEFGNIHHEFAESESRLDLEYVSGARVHMVWPAGGQAFFWVEFAGVEVTSAAKAKETLSRTGLVPTLTPVERFEKKLSREHLSKNVETKLASRHFRNNLQAEKERSAEGYRALISYLLDNTPELVTLEVEETYRDGAAWLDVFYRDPASPMLKEIFWAGDGLQIWLQILYHLWRTQAEKVVILDEPDVFLHPDLQRRLVRVIELTGRQSILSSHAAEIASEASLAALVWIDRSRSSARRISDDVQLEQLSAELGSAFNLSIARALRSKLALFVEGKDMKILRVLARRAGLAKLAAEVGIAVVPIGGFSHWPSVEAFGWIKSQFLGSQVKVRLLLDSDYRGDTEAISLVHKMAASGVVAHVWSRKELESYLLEVPVLARVSGLTYEVAEGLLDEILESLRVDVQSKFVGVQVEIKDRSVALNTSIRLATAAFEELWANADNRIRIVPAKEVISSWNSKVLERGGKTVTAAKLAAAMQRVEMDSELLQFLSEVEDDLA